MRYLTFTPDDAALYQVAHAALLTAPAERTAGGTRLIGKLFDIVEAIGRPGPDAFYKLRDEGGVCAFEDVEFVKFVELVGACAVNSPAIRTTKIPLLDRLDAAPTTAPES